MALTITENNGVYQVQGALNVNTAKHFLSHCELIMNIEKQLVIDVQFLSEIDDDGIGAIRALYKNALYKDFGFFIEGNNNKKLYEAFPFTVAAA